MKLHNKKRKRVVCDCSRPATKVSNNELVCAFCYECERSGCTGGPTKHTASYAAKEDDADTAEPTPEL
jgi:hypothetical protein